MPSRQDFVSILLSVGLAAVSLCAQTAPRTYVHDAAGNRSSVLNQIRLDAAAGMFVEPERAMAGESLNLYGRGFPAGQPGQVAVVLGGQVATVLSVADRVITVQVPAGVVTGPVTLALQGGAPVTIGTIYLHGVTVSPNSVELDYGQQQQFAATVVGATNTAVAWSIADLNGGTTGIGTITAAGLYTAPAVSSTPVGSILARARNAELGITAYALVRLSCVDRGTIANRSLVNDALPAGNARVCYQFTAQAQQRAYIAYVSATSARYLALRDADGSLVAWTGPGTRLRLPDVVLRTSGTYRVEVQGNATATPSLQLWADVHAPLPRAVWMFPADDSWHTAANWSNGQLPQSGDNVVVPDFAGISLRVAISQNLVVRSLQSEEGLRVTSGTLTLGDTASPPPFSVRGGIDLAGGALNGSAIVDCEGASLWSGSTLSGSGRLVIAPAGTLALQSGALAMDLNRVLEVQGNATWTSGLLRMTNGTLRTVGTFTANTGGTLSCSGNAGTNAWVNTGTVRKTGTGSVSVVGGSVGVSCQGDGTWDVQAGSFVINSTSSLSTGLLVTGAGDFEIGGGTTTFNGSGSVTGNLVVSGGIGAFDGTTTVTGGFRLTAGSVAGTGTLRIDGTGAWSGGTMSGQGQAVVGPSGTLALQSGALAMDLNRVLEVQGNATWTSGLLRMTNGTLRTVGTLTAVTTGTLTCSGNAGTNAWVNTGTVRKTGTGSVSVVGGSVGVSCQGGGTWDVQVGRFVINSTSSLSTGLLVTGAGDFEIGGGTTTFTGSGSVSGNLVVSGGIGAFQGTTTVTGGFRMDAGSVAGTGTLHIDGAGVWLGGSMSGAGQTVVGIPGSMEMRSVANVMDLNRVLEVQGDATWTSGLLRMTGGTLRTVGTFTANTAGTLTCSGNAGTNAWVNTGTVRKIGIGSVSVVGGSVGVSCQGGGTWDVQVGRFVINATSSLSNGLLVTGAGDLEISGGTTTFSGSGSVSGNLVVSGGIGAFDGTTTVTGGFRMDAGSVAGTGTLRIDGAGVWLGGAMSGAGQTVVGATGTLALQSAALVMDLNRVLEVQGNATWTSGLLRMSGGTLRTVGTFTANTGGTLTCSGNSGTNAWVNSGTVRKTGTGSVNVVGGSVGVSCQGGGTWDVQTGRFVINATSSLSTGLLVTGAGDLEIGGGTTTFTGNSSVSGNLVVSGGIGAFDGTTTVTGAFRMDAGSAAGTGTLRIDGTGTWLGGAMSGAGQTVVGPTGTLALQSGALVMDLNRVLEVQGNATWTSGLLRMSTGTLRNLGSFTADSNGSLSCSGNAGTNACSNQGVFTKLGTGSVTFSAGSVGITVSNAGTMDVVAGTVSVGRLLTQTAGALRLLGGALAASGGLSLTGGVLEGSGTITGNVTNAAIVRPAGSGAPGVLTISGTYTQTAAGALEIDVGGTVAGTEFDRLAVSGTAALAGSLAVALFGGFTPAPPQVFDVVQHATGSTGTLTCTNCSPTFALSHLTTAVRLLAQ